MGNSNRKPYYTVGTNDRNMMLAFVRFTANTGSAPTVYSDKSNVLDATTPFTVTATGRIKLNLADRWDLVGFCGGGIEDATAGDDLELFGKSEGTSAANYVEIKTINGGSLADTTNVCHVLLCLSR